MDQLEVIAHHSVGWYFNHGWEIAPSGDPLLSRVASLHEFGHSALNSSTSWGALIQQLALSQQFTDDPAVGRTLQAAVSAARRTHEAFATHVSVTALGELAPAGERLLAAQPGYVAFLHQARSVGPRPDTAPQWQDPEQVRAACQAALTACMQSRGLHALLTHGATSFRLAMVPNRDWPDIRLRALSRLAGTLWPSLPPPHTGADAYRYSLAAVSDALNAAGFPSMSTAKYQALLPALTADLNELAHRHDGNVQLDVDGYIGIPGLFGTEVVRVRAPIPARVQRLPTRPEVDRLATRGLGPEHIYIAVRRSSTLRTQFAIAPGTVLPDNEPVAAVVTPTVDAGRVTQLDLSVLHERASLDSLPAGVSIVTCLSLDCLLDDEWRETWLTKLRRHSQVIGLLDLPVVQVLDGWLRTGETLHFGFITTAHTPEPEPALVFRLGSDEPVILPATLAATYALMTYVERASAGKVTAEEAPVDATDEAAARLVLTHLVAEDAVRPCVS